MNDFEDGGNLSDTPLRDVFANLAVIFFVLFAMISLHSLMKTVEKKEDQIEQVKMWGDIMITIKWPDKEDVDVDLWAKSPDDSSPVGYSRVRGTTLTLLKDITGFANNPTGRMREVVFGDGVPDGRYTVNIHLYRNGSKLTEVPVEAEVFTLDGSKTVSIVKKKVVLTRIGEEITIANFTMRNKKLVGRPDDIYVPLRAAASSPTSTGPGVGP